MTRKDIWYLSVTALAAISFAIFVSDWFPTNNASNTPKYVIIDTDMGADDAWALQLMLKAEKVFNKVKVLAITTANGNTKIEHVIKNTYFILEGLNRTDIPIYKGAEEALLPLSTMDELYWGENGFSDVDFSISVELDSIIQRQTAVEKIRELVVMHPHEISLFCLGPLTNVALAIRSYPEIKSLIKEVYIMGGSTKGRGNIGPVAEYNFYKDPESAYIVLNSNIAPMTVLPLDVNDYMHIPLDWRFNILKDVDQPNVQFLNQVEEIAHTSYGDEYYLSMDFFAVAAFLFPEKVVQTMTPYSATMELSGSLTRGQMIINHASKDYNVNVIEKISVEEFKKILLWTAHYNE